MYIYIYIYNYVSIDTVGIPQEQNQHVVLSMHVITKYVPTKQV